MPHPHDPMEESDEDRSDDSDSDLLSADMACPTCRKPVTIETQKCPHCGDWITPVYPSSGRPPRWLFVVAVLLMLLAMLRFIL